MRTFTFKYDVVATITVTVDADETPDAMDMAQREAQRLAASLTDVSTEDASVVISVPDGVQPSTVIVS